ncbi:hypothetical protein CC1G_07930 [Coprinopsis cinerea okayama7|uniref:DUF6697 domain-containing protein n=1 Tax=Coprinopsis cinerea (strain Okayama-7 / 130 / ATCC MYA-4618 / FGSC 9003) TaxID=240176 RepID=A8P6S1_COPC7|nr:hypothetical protein CC1G_07930 [Coprinopsis cinerea okayama7\|eukprot:XP_001839215.2 hypothetical protein CC1G_07930 [Coprinopsis cinerea okayama7\
MDHTAPSPTGHPHLPTVIEIISTLGRELLEAKERIQQLELELALGSCSRPCRESQVPGLQLQRVSQSKPGSQLIPATGTDPSSSRPTPRVPAPTASQPTSTVPASSQTTATLPLPTTSQLENLESRIHQLQEERETLLEEGWKLKLKVTNLQTEIDTIRGIKREELAAQALSSSLHRQNEENVKRKTSDEHDRVLDLEATIASLKSDLDERDFKISELKQANSLLERRGKAWSLQDYLPILTHLPNVAGRPGPRGMPLCSVMERGVLEGALKGVLEGMLAQPENDRTNGANANATPYLYLPRALLCLPGEAQHNLALAPKYRFDVEGGVAEQLAEATIINFLHDSETVNPDSVTSESESKETTHQAMTTESTHQAMTKERTHQAMTNGSTQQQTMPPYTLQKEPTPTYKYTLLKETFASMYANGVLRVECMVLQCVGYDEELCRRIVKELDELEESEE